MKEEFAFINFRKNEVLFNFYNFSGYFPEEVKAFEGSLVD